MEKKYSPITGVEGISIAKDVNDTSEGYSAGVPSDLFNAVNVNWATEQASEDLYASNKRKDRYFGTKKESLTFQVTGFSAEEDAAFRGLFFNPATGRVESAGDEEPPYTAVGLKINKGKDDFVYVWFLKGLISGGAIVAETKKDGVTIQTREYKYESLVTDKQWDLNGTPKGRSWIKGDTTTPGFDGSSWFAQVQTPDTVSAPAAIELSSIEPADGAIDVAIDKEPKLIFNNPIAEEAIQIMATSNGDIVAVTKSWSADRKQLTLSHASAFDASEIYRVIIAGVKDVHGQELAAVTKDFAIVDS